MGFLHSPSVLSSSSESLISSLSFPQGPEFMWGVIRKGQPVLLRGILSIVRQWATGPRMVHLNLELGLEATQNTASPLLLKL
jgi:hypothetical protein